MLKNTILIKSSTRRKKQKMREDIIIKNKINFICGIICLMCFITNIIVHRDIHIIIITGLFTFINILAGVIGW